MSEPQNMLALRRANEIRMHAAHVKREIRPKDHRGPLRH